MAPQNNLAESLSIKPYVLGLDLGTDSIGWAVLDWNGEQPTAIRRLGVRRFEAGVLGNIEAGRDKVTGTARRTARQQPPTVAKGAHTCGTFFASRRSRTFARQRRQCRRTLSDNQYTEQNLAQHHLPPASNANRHTWHLLPYQLRAAAVKVRLQPFALGRTVPSNGPSRLSKQSESEEG